MRAVGREGGERERESEIERSRIKDVEAHHAVCRP